MYYKCVLITEESSTKEINEIIPNESYLAKAKESSAIFKDDIVHPMDMAMYWIEYVAKFHGAKHLKSKHAVKMSWLELIDVIFVNLLAAFILI